MAKYAHITTQSGITVGTKALALCGKQWKVKMLWADVPKDYPICRGCLNYAINALDSADELLGNVRRQADLVESMVARLQDRLHPPHLALDLIAEAREDFEAERQAKRDAKEARKQAKRTCICSWTSPEIFVEDPDCPIHGEEEDSSES